MKKMGLFGGSFDPIHKGHVSMALRLAQAMELDGVVLMGESMVDTRALTRLIRTEGPLTATICDELTQGGESDAP